MHKTGTSSVQATFAASKMNNATYVSWRPSPNHSEPFADAFEPDGFSRKKGLSQKPWEVRHKEARDILAEQIAQCETDRLIISGEYISTAQPVALSNFVNFVKDRVEKISVVLYIRPPISFYQSAFQQRMKNAGKPVFFPGRKSLVDRCENLDAAFGADNVNLVVFDRARLIGGDVIEDLSQRFDLGVSASDIQTKNESLSLEALAVMVAFRTLSERFKRQPVPVAASRLFASSCLMFGSKKWGFGRQLFEEMRAHTEPERVYLEKRMGVVFDEKPKIYDPEINSMEDLVHQGGLAGDALLEQINKLVNDIEGDVPTLRAEVSAAANLPSGPERTAAMVDAAIIGLSALDQKGMRQLRQILAAA